MSEVGRSARVSIIVADYIAGGQAGKITIVGSGITIAGVDPKTGTTAPLSIVALVTFDPKFLGESPTVELSLETDDGAVVEVPASAGGEADGQSLPLRVAASNLLQHTAFEGFEIPSDAVRPKVQLIMQFQSGLPLQPGRRYIWRVTVDGESRDEWTDAMYVPQVSARA